MNKNLRELYIKRLNSSDKDRTDRVSKLIIHMYKEAENK